MNDPLAEAYLNWLASQVGGIDGEKSYWDLLAVMFEKEYGTHALIPNDENRLEDGLDIRREYLRGLGIPNEGLGPPSFLEVLIGLSRRMEFAAGGSAPAWAWQLACNLELHRMPDPMTRHKARKVNDILDACIGRDYPTNGLGSFFPLAWSDQNQTTVEIWYQMAAYINELPEH